MLIWDRLLFGTLVTRVLLLTVCKILRQTRLYMHDLRYLDGKFYNPILLWVKVEYILALHAT